MPPRFVGAYAAMPLRPESIVESRSGRGLRAPEIWRCSRARVAARKNTHGGALNPWRCIEPSPPSPIVHPLLHALQQTLAVSSTVCSFTASVYEVRYGLSGGLSSAIDISLLTR